MSMTLTLEGSPTITESPVRLVFTFIDLRSDAPVELRKKTNALPVPTATARGAVQADGVRSSIDR